MQKRYLRSLVFAILPLFATAIAPARAGDQDAARRIQEEIWALPLPLPMFAYLVRPTGDGPFPLVIMNHGVSLNPRERSFFPLVEFRDAAKWFASRGYLVVAPVGSGYGASAIDIPGRAIYGPFFSKIGKCSNPNFSDPGLAIAQVDLWIIDYLAAENLIVPKDVIVVGQSAGGWGSIALSSLNPPQVKAIIAFAAGRGGRVDGKPNNNCAPDKLVEATAQFGRTSRVPMLWIYIENDTFFGPDLSRRMHEAFAAAGGNAEYHLLPPFGNEGHFLIGSPNSIPIWSPLVTRFLGEHVSQQQTTSPSENAKADVTPRGQRAANDITYGGWQKLCFKPGGARTMCRTTIAGKFTTGQIAVRVDLIEREGDDGARLQLFLPVGMYLQAGVKLSVDKGHAYRIPYTWCLTNACIAAELADPKLIEAMESGQTMELEVVDTNILSLATSLPLAQFAAVRRGPPAKTFEQEIDE
jgi:dienelactone hydrolase/invasion protein IalB